MLNSKNPLFEQYCAFTGRLQKYTRKEAMQLVANIGGLSECGVTKRTRFLILGTQIKDGKSRKQLKAEKNLEKGQAIEIIPEVVFYDMLASGGYGQICLEEWILSREGRTVYGVGTNHGNEGPTCSPEADGEESG